MELVVAAPEVVKKPPAMMSPFGRLVRAMTASSIPPFIADHVVPFHLATKNAETPPAEIKSPPAMRSPLERTVRALTTPLIPVPSVDQVVPFHRAMLLAERPPAFVNWPATTRSPLGSTARALTVPEVPGEPMPALQPGVHWAWGTVMANATRKDEARVGAWSVEGRVIVGFREVSTSANVGLKQR